MIMLFKLFVVVMSVGSSAALTWHFQRVGSSVARSKARVAFARGVGSMRMLIVLFVFVMGVG